MSRYIHLNPVMANMVELPEDYTPSSYRFLIGLGDCDIVNREKILSYFKQEDAHMLYQQFVESKLLARKDPV